MNPTSSLSSEFDEHWWRHTHMQQVMDWWLIILFCIWLFLYLHIKIFKSALVKVMAWYQVGVVMTNFWRHFAFSGPLTKISKPVSRPWISNCIHIKQWDVITHLCFNGSFTLYARGGYSLYVGWYGCAAVLTPFFDILGIEHDLLGVIFLIHQHQNDLLGY